MNKFLNVIIGWMDGSIDPQRYNYLIKIEYFTHTVQDTYLIIYMWFTATSNTSITHIHKKLQDKTLSWK